MCFEGLAGNYRQSTKLAWICETASHANGLLRGNLEEICPHSISELRDL
jgi:hypothetical protein